MLISFKASNKCIAQYEINLLPHIGETVIIKDEKYKVIEISHEFKKKNKDTIQSITITLLKLCSYVFNYNMDSVEKTRS